MNIPKISEEEVQNIALVYRLGLSPEDISRLSSELSNILEQFRVLDNVDTSGINPTGHSVSADGTMREDEPSSSLPVNKILQNAPSVEKGYFRVKAVLE
ncbi:MAG: Asp-tRNA(Asn)/Glu-tRNA(Gln) amidotransferase subunit GatC [Dehalococcoidia bacterium]|nr:Asp-tRNA(Asn)/Glu-tRNA(Gln) amidotransferase subunit GatC [Dehalococcoidia bacterium]